MKKIGFSIVAAVVVLSSLTLTAAAQGRILAQANIPFSFAAHGQTFDAGAYEICQMGAQVVRLQDVKTRRGVTLLSPQNVGVSTPTKIVFRRYGDRHFLAAVVTTSYQISVPKSRPELEVASARMKTTMVALQSTH
jgi:hypothetical protein